MSKTLGSPHRASNCGFGPAVLFCALVLCSLASALSAGAFNVVTVNPQARSLSAAPTAVIQVTFNQPVDPTTVVARDTFWAFGRWSGPVDGTFSFANGNKSMTLTPDQPFSAGENVMVVLSSGLAAMDGSPLRDAGFSYQFWVGTAAASLEFTEADRMTTRTTPEQDTQSYGGFATDLDGDGFPDLTIVNEVTSDLRVFMNQGEGSGLFDSFLTPTEPSGSVPSPSEPSDFNSDGLPDVAVANISGNSISIFLGNGDGTFQPHQEIPVGGQARGIAVLDADGDGDTDVAATSGPSGDFALILNNGSGVFGAAQHFGTGNFTPRALGAADMDEDGILDLVVGFHNSGLIVAWTGNGDGTFTANSASSAGGDVWMIAIGDVNGDGHEDVSSANSFTDSAAIILGDGAAGFSPFVSHPTDPFVLATDLGDLDGDGDLDWIVASYLGDWRLFLNDGTGTFTFDREFPATQAASCSVMVDMDNDLDLDIALIDEEEDEFILMHNAALVLFGDGFESGDTSSWSTTVP